MFELNPQLDRLELDEEEETFDNTPARRGRPKGGAQQTGPSDLELVERYKDTAAKFGTRSNEAGAAFEPIFSRFWPYVYNLALTKMGALYAEDLANESLQTVWERLNGKEVVTNLRGLVRHSFEREYASLLERLLQGRKLQRARQTSGETTVDDEAGRVKGAVVVSLNATAPGTDDEDLEMINLLEDASADVVEAATRRELMRVLHELIEEMPAQYRAPLVCQWLMGMRIRTVAQELNLTVDQVKHNTARGIAWLRKRMPGDSVDWLA